MFWVQAEALVEILDGTLVLAQRTVRKASIVIRESIFRIQANGFVVFNNRSFKLPQLLKFGGGGEMPLCRVGFPAGSQGQCEQ